MVRGLVVAVALGACSFEHGAVFDGDARRSGSDHDATMIDAPSGPWLTGFTHRKPITITSPANSTLTNFPVGVLTTDPQLASARDDGRDIVFTTADGTTPLDHELVSFDRNSGTLEAWVRMPTLPQGATTIFVYYGGASQNPAGATTWPSAFVGVWHLGTALADSTSHNHPAFATNIGTTPAVRLGVANNGNAREFDGSDDVLTVGHPSDGTLDFGTTSFSFTMWVNATASNGAFDGALYKGGASVSDPGYCVLLGSASWNMKVHDGASYRDPGVGAEALGQWIYVAGVFDKSANQMRGYRNGVQSDMQAIGSLNTIANTRSLVLGVAGGYYHGAIDELRISNGALSPDWIAAEYANLSSSSFAALGPEQTQAQ